jgi:rod shape-determining protein MreC
MVQRRGNFRYGLHDPARMSKIILASGLLVVVLVGLKIGSMLAGRSSSVDKALVATTAPLAVGANRVGEGISGIGLLLKLPELLESNEQLTADNAVLMARVSELEQLEAENNQLREQLKIKSKPTFRTVSAVVVARPFDLWVETAVLSAGTERGITQGCVVTSDGALVGRISEASRGFSRVELVSSPNFRIAGVVNGNVAEGVVRGISANELELVYVRSGAGVEIEAKVFTRGSEKIETADLYVSPPVPGGILVGSVVERSTNAGFLNIKIRPAANTNRLSVVTVYLP